MAARHSTLSLRAVMAEAEMMAVAAVVVAVTAATVAAEVARLARW